MNKILDNLQFRVFTDIVEKSEKNGKRRIRGYASTDDLDRQGEVISIEALRQAANHLLENPTVFYEHKHDSYPVGLCVSSEIDDKGLLIEVEISETASTLWTLIQEGILNRFSIGGRVTSAEEKVGEDNKPYNEITGIDLFEVSVVGLPANPEARFEVVNKSFSMAIADEIKKRKEDSEMEEKKKIETIDGTSDVIKLAESKTEEKKVEEVVEDKKEEVTKVEKKEASKVEDKAEASEKPKEEKAVTEKVQEEKSEETVEEKPVEKKIEKEIVIEEKVVEGEKVEEQKEVVKDTKEVEAKEEKVAEAKTEPVESDKVEEKVTTTVSDTTLSVDKTNDTTSDDTSTIQINLLPDKTEDKISEVKEEKSEEVTAIVVEKPAEEKVEEKPEIKTDDSIVTDEEFEKLVVEDISKPYPNEHAARIRPVSDFQEGSFRSKQIAEGIRIIIGRLIGETTATVQSYRFHVDHFTAEEAKKWLKDHDVTYILFEPAKKSEEKPEEKKEETIVEAEVPKVEEEEIKIEEKPAEEKKEDKEIVSVRVLSEEKLLELLNKLNDKIDALGEKINAIELANQAKIAEKVSEKPKVEEKKEEPKTEKKEEKLTEEKPQRKSFIADAPYANDRKKDEEKKEKDTKKTTDKGWTQIVYGR